MAYAIATTSYGALQLGHDLLHYLGTHYRVHLHDHHHDHDHHFGDHNHRVADHHHESGEETNFPTWLHFFLFTEPAENFSFATSFNGTVSTRTLISDQQSDHHPATPPPQGILTFS